MADDMADYTRTLRLFRPESRLQVAVIMPPGVAADVDAVHIAGDFLKDLAIPEGAWLTTAWPTSATDLADFLELAAAELRRWS